MENARGIYSTRRGLLFSVLWPLMTIAKSTSMTNSAQPSLSGTFLQLLEKHASWTELQWKQLFDELNGIGVHDLILQWSVTGDLAFYPSTEFRSVKNEPLERLLRMADAAEMRVTIGLAHDDKYWSYVRKDPGQVAEYLKVLRTKSLTVAYELAPLLRQHQCAQGWYICEEVDDISWRGRDARIVFLEHVSGTSRELKKLAPKWPVAISAFSQAQSSPGGFRQFWDEFFQRVNVDAVLYQDGVGVGNLDLNGLPVYLRAIRSAADQNRRWVTVVVELFQQTSGPPLDNLKFSAEPASMTRIACQLEMAAKYSSNGIVGFSIPDYMTPSAGAAAGKLLSDYRRFISGSGPFCDRK